jgi:DNA-binding NarL/FixJ family response regulator
MERPRRLTRSQLSVVRLLAEGLTPEQVAQRRSRSLSATYELIGRICDRWQLTHWSEIAPKARGESTDGRANHETNSGIGAPN